jgi:hypothetical protein
VFGSAIGLHQISDFFSQRLADPKLSPLVVGLGAFGVVVALFALAVQRQASLARKWPIVSGTIKLSKIEEYRAAPTGRETRGQVMYQRKVSYSYIWNRISYTNMHASLASNVASTSSWLVRKSTSAWQDGATVKVYVNPVNPSEATLEPRASFVWILWFFVAAFLAGAYYLAVHG